MAELHTLDLVGVAGLLHSKAISPVEVTNALLARIEACDPALRAFSEVTVDLAQAQAKRAEAEIRGGAIRGPLHGVPIAVKQNFFTQGIATPNGMPVLADFIPDFDATVVERLFAGGAILIGKVQQTEGAFIEHHPDIAPPVNPWGADHWSGVSSSGSGVAVAAGFCYAALGTDTGGSIRMPCDMNGVTGMKPTYGRVSRHGVWANSPMLDHVGPLGRSAADIAAVLQSIAGHDPRDPTSLFAPVPDYTAGIGDGVGGIRIGVDWAFVRHEVDPAIASMIGDALAIWEMQGASIVEIRFPDPELVIGAWLRQSAIEMAVAHEATYPSRKDEYGPVLSGFIELGRSSAGADYQKAILAREFFKAQLADIHRHVDVIALPTQSVAGPTCAEMAEMMAAPDAVQRLARFTCMFDMTGNPLVILPGGRTSAGIPMSFQLVGRHLEESLLFAAAHSFQQHSGWHSMRPEIG